jgi:hypothetical protein
MTRKPASRFDFLDEVAAEVAQGEEASPPPALASSSQPYLFQPVSRTEPLAPLGNRVRLPAKHALEDYVRTLKRDGYPATEARVLEALMLLLDEDPAVQARVTHYLTGKTD